MLTNWHRWSGNVNQLASEAAAWQPDVTVIEGADHHYRETEQALGAELVRWLGEQNGIGNQL